MTYSKLLLTLPHKIKLKPEKEQNLYKNLNRKLLKKLQLIKVILETQHQLWYLVIWDLNREHNPF